MSLYTKPSGHTRQLATSARKAVFDPVNQSELFTVVRLFGVCCFHSVLFVSVKARVLSLDANLRPITDTVSAVDLLVMLL